MTRTPICPKCGENLIQPDGPGHHVCPSCGWVFPSNELDGEGVRELPSPADEGFVGTALNSELKRWIGLGERNETGLLEIVRDFQGKPITTANSMLPPDRQHVLKRIYDRKEQKTWEQRQMETFWLENCEKMRPESLGRAMKLLQEKIAQEKRAYRDSVKGFMRRLSS